VRITVIEIRGKDEYVIGVARTPAQLARLTGFSIQKAMFDEGPDLIVLRREDETATKD
jgi:hypothetical protein